MAPEYIVHGQLTEKADIYSYGVLVLEIITGRKNHNSVASSAEGLSLMALVVVLLLLATVAFSENLMDALCFLRYGSTTTQGP